MQVCFVRWGQWLLKYWDTSLHEKKPIYLPDTFVRALLDARSRMVSYQENREQFATALSKTVIKPGQKPVHCSPAHLVRSLVAASNCEPVAAGATIDQVSLCFQVLANEDQERKLPTFVPNLVQQLIHQETLSCLGVRYSHTDAKADQDSRESGMRDLTALDWKTYSEEDDCSFSGFEQYLVTVLAFLDATNWLPLPKYRDLSDVFSVVSYSMGEEPCSCQFCQPIDKTVLASPLAELARITSSLIEHSEH